MHQKLILLHVKFIMSMSFEYFIIIDNVYVSIIMNELTSGNVNVDRSTRNSIGNKCVYSQELCDALMNDSKEFISRKMS